MTIRSGPTTKNSGSVVIGLMQIRIGPSAANIAETEAVLETGDSLGAMASTKYMGNVDWWKLESGYTLQTDAFFPIREESAIECAFQEQSPYNIVLAHGLDPSGEYPNQWSGEIKLGARSAPEYLRCEAIRTYPDQTHKMYIIYPRSQITSSVEIEDSKEEGASTPITITATPADSGATGGNVVWDNMPLGRIYWDPIT